MTALASPLGPAALVPDTDLRRPARLGLVGVLALVGVLGGWAATTRIDGAVVSGGEVVVRGRPQLVQSLDPGVVQAIEVRNGDRVAAGEVLVRLDPTLARTNLGIAEARLADALALRARLEAEERGQGPDGAATAFRHPPLPFPRPDTSRQEEAQARILAARAEVLAGGRARLAETLAQIDAQIAGTEAEIAAKESQRALLAEDLADLTRLSEQGLTRDSELNELTRAAAEIDGQVASLGAEVARLRLTARDAELATLQEERAFREEVATELREANAEVDELVLEVVTRRAELERAELRSPADGIVHEMEVVTPGGVVAAGATLLQVMPLDRGYEFELKVDPRSIDQVHPGQPAELVVAPLDPRSTPRLEAEVASVSAGAISNERSGESFYRVSLRVSESELARLGTDVALVPGMPVEGYLQTGNRSVLEYLVEPLAAHLRRAFREE